MCVEHFFELIQFALDTRICLSHYPRLTRFGQAMRN